MSHRANTTVKPASIVLAGIIILAIASGIYIIGDWIMGALHSISYSPW